MLNIADFALSTIAEASGNRKTNSSFVSLTGRFMNVTYFDISTATSLQLALLRQVLLPQCKKAATVVSDDRRYKILTLLQSMRGASAKDS